MLFFILIVISLLSNKIDINSDAMIGLSLLMMMELIIEIGFIEDKWRKYD